MKTNLKQLATCILGATLVVILISSGVVFAQQRGWDHIGRGGGGGFRGGGGHFLNPRGITVSSSTFVTLSDIYNRLTDNTFVNEEHSVSTTSAPEISMNTLLDIWDAIPEISADTIAIGTTIMGVDGSLVVSGASASVDDLSDMAFSNSPSGYTFTGGTYTYDNVSVPNPVTSISVTPTGAGTIIVNDLVVTFGQASGAISLNVGSNIITVLVAESNKVSKTYTINITRGEIATDLTGLDISGSPVNYAFAGSNYTYNGVTVLNVVESITITPTGAGTITVDGTPVNSAESSASIALDVGIEKTILVVVSESGKSDKTYTIKITRNNVGLVWSTEQGSMDWVTAGTTCANQGWRLPTIDELKAAFLPWNNNGFQDLTFYWSSSEDASGNAWAGYYMYGYVDGSHDANYYQYSVRCVQ